MHERWSRRLSRWTALHRFPEQVKPSEERSRQSQPETGCLSAVSLGSDPEGGGGSSEGRGEGNIRTSTLTASVVKYQPDFGSGKTVLAAVQERSLSGAEQMAVITELSGER